MTLTLMLQCSISYSSELFSYTTVYSNFMFINRFFLNYCSKSNTDDEREREREREREGGGRHTDEHFCFAKRQL